MRKGGWGDVMALLWVVGCFSALAKLSRRFFEHVGLAIGYGVLCL